MSSTENLPVSVVMPAYNAEKTIAAAIRSLHEQTMERFELIIVDDGSTDRTPEIIRQWSDLDGRIRSVRIQHGGIVAALNEGLEMAAGSCIARMDADDLSAPARLEKQYRYLEQHPSVGLVSCLVSHWGHKKKKAGYARHVRWINSLTSPGEIAIHRFVESPVAHPSVMFRRSLIDRYGGYRDGPFPEDYELWLRWMEQGVQFDKVAENLLDWRDEPDRLSRIHPRYSFDAFYEVKAKYLSRWLEKNNPHHPEVIIWGAGRTTRKRAEMLVQHGIEITHYVDIDPNKIGNDVQSRPVIGPDEIPEPGTCFIIPYVARHGAHAMIGDVLEEKGYVLGVDHIFAA